MTQLTIRPLAAADLQAVKRFTDAEIGAGYYAMPELDDVFRRSQAGTIMCSFVLVDATQAIKGVRITYPPGQWKQGKGSGLTVMAWPNRLDETGYFQSLFVAADLQGQGWGGRLSERALEALRAAGAKGVVCHSWKESPNDSSTRYLKKLGFTLIAEHPLYWKDVDYNCTRCQKPPCQCTAQEMYLDLRA